MVAEPARNKKAGMFFFEKKNQKTFVRSGCGLLGAVRWCCRWRAHFRKPRYYRRGVGGPPTSLRNDAGQLLPPKRRPLPYGQRTSGGKLIRMASTFPPVFSPNVVPRS